jgi:hypothetical protein
LDNGRGTGVFGDSYYARSRRDNPAEQLEIDRLERRWREERKVVLPSYFQTFGVPSAWETLRLAREQAFEEEKKQAQRAPTTAEQESIRRLSHMLRELAPEVSAIFDKGNTSYTVARTDVILGALRFGRRYNSREVFLAESVFAADFAEALATFLHEHAHIFGYDGSRAFTDALTGLLETVMRHRRDLDRYEQEWEGARAAVRRERQAGKGQSDTDSMEAWLAALDETALRQLMSRIPAPVLRKLRHNPPRGG